MSSSHLPKGYALPCCTQSYFKVDITSNYHVQNSTSFALVAEQGGHRIFTKIVRLDKLDTFEILLQYRSDFDHPNAFRYPWERQQQHLVAEVHIVQGIHEVERQTYEVPYLREKGDADRKVTLTGMRAGGGFLMPGYDPDFERERAVAQDEAAGLNVEPRDDGRYIIVRLVQTTIPERNPRDRVVLDEFHLHLLGYREYAQMLWVDMVHERRIISASANGHIEEANVAPEAPVSRHGCPVTSTCLCVRAAEYLGDV